MYEHTASVQLRAIRVQSRKFCEILIVCSSTRCDIRNITETDVIFLYSETPKRRYASERGWDS